MQRYFSKFRENDYLKLDSDDWHHINNVMRLNENDLIEVVYDQVCYICKIVNYDSELKVVITDIKEESRQNIPEVVLLIPLLKEAKMDLIIQKSTELGVGKIIPIKLSRSIIKLEDKKISKKIDRWNRIAKEASEQSKRLNIPVVDLPKTIDEIKNISGLKLICSTRSLDNNLHNLLQTSNTYDRIVVVIGPEGGLSNEEEDLFIKFGFKPVRLGNNIMRVETVPIFFMSIINYEYME